MGWVVPHAGIETGEGGMLGVLELLRLCALLDNKLEEQRLLFIALAHVQLSHMRNGTAWFGFRLGFEFRFRFGFGFGPGG